MQIVYIFHSTKNKYLAQISLPRINRINTSMFWENHNPFNSNGGHFLKIYIYLIYFSRNFFQIDLIFFLKFWSWNHKNFKINKNTPNILKKKNFNFNITKYQKLLSLNTYIFVMSNKLYILFIHTPELSFKPRKILKKLSKKELNSFLLI